MGEGTSKNNGNDKQGHQWNTARSSRSRSPSPPPLPHPVMLKGHPGENSLKDNPWQLEYPDKDEVGSVIFNSQPRRWLRIDKSGHAEYLTMERQELVRDLNISYRDVRILDPLISAPYPTALLIREKALVCNFEAVRMIITANECYVLSIPNPHQPGVIGQFPALDSDFVHELTGLITQRGQHHTYSTHAASELDAKMPFELRALEAALQASGRALGAEVSAMEARALPSCTRLMQKITDDELENMRNTKAALNALIQRVGKVRHELEETLDDDQEMLDMYLGRRAKQQQAEAKKAERYAQRYRERDAGRAAAADGGENDATGADSARRQREARDAAADGDEVAADEDGSTAQGTGSAGRARGGGGGRRSSAQLLRSSLQEARHNEPYAVDPRSLSHSASAPEHMQALMARLQEIQDGGGSQGEGLTLEDVAAAGLFAMAKDSGRGHAPPDPRDISECEGLLEVYLKQSDSLLRRLGETRGRIADTEAAIEVMLDQRRNGLVASFAFHDTAVGLQALTLVVNTIMLSFSAVAMVVGAFGMNFATWMSDMDAPTSKRNFLLAFLITSGIAGVMFLSVMLYARYKRLLWIPDVTS